MGKSTVALTDEQIAALTDLDAQEPYASMTIDQALKTYNDAIVIQYGSASSSVLNKWAAVNGTRKAIFQASENYDHPAYEAAAAARFAIENTAEELDISDLEVQGLLGNLVVANLISAAAKDDLFKRVERKVSPGQTIGIPKVRKAYIEYVRGVL